MMLSTVIGNIEIGDNVIVGAKSVVMHDVEEGATVVGSPIRKVKQRLSDGTTITYNRDGSIRYITDSDGKRIGDNKDCDSCASRTMCKSSEKK